MKVKIRKSKGRGTKVRYSVGIPEILIEFLNWNVDKKLELKVSNGDLILSQEV